MKQRIENMKRIERSSKYGTITLSHMEDKMKKELSVLVLVSAIAISFALAGNSHGDVMRIVDVGSVSTRQNGVDRFSGDIKPEVPEPSSLTVIHGIPRLPEPVVLTAGGSSLFEFDYKESRGPLELPAGSYRIGLLLQGTEVLSADIELERGKNYTAVAHLTYIDGESTGIDVTLFENNTSPIDARRTRLTVRHTADAPSVDVELRYGWGHKIFALKGLDIANYDEYGPEQFGEIDLRGGTYGAWLYPAGTDVKVYDSGDLRLKSGQSYVVYAVGSIFDGTFDLVIQVIGL